MKRSLLWLSSTLLLTSLVACSSMPASYPTGFAPAPALRSFSTDFPDSMNGATQTLSSQREDSPQPKEVDSELANRPSRGEPKPVLNPPVSYPPPSRGVDNIANTASFALDSMNRARSWESGYRIGEQTLKGIASDAYVARLALAASGPSMKWETAYYVLAYALQHIASAQPNTVENTCNLVLKMMDKSKTWEEGSRIGFATLKFIRQTATPNMSSFIDTAVSSADAARYWEDTYKTLASAFQQMKTLKP